MGFSRRRKMSSGCRRGIAGRLARTLLALELEAGDHGERFAAGHAPASGAGRRKRRQLVQLDVLMLKKKT